ncbi:GGDEF domain-containing protein [Salinicoccus sesuvii]|uniref:GGDEF domain-containing protein n=1 Tax=Salinicoccus sesuvii TaxID=868281 RepID=A0ABV7N747_9STAP
MLIDFVLNISITISGIYLFHRLQYLEDRRIIDSNIFQALLMTTLAVLLLMVPIEIQDMSFSLYFIPLLILVKYSVPYMMIISAGAVFLFHHLIFNFDWQRFLVFLILYVVMMLILPFLNFQKLKELTIVVLIFTVLYGLGIHVFVQPLTLFQAMVLIAASTVVMFFAIMMYEDINKILGLLKRYEEEEYKDFLTQLGNVKALDNSAEKMIESSQKVSLLLIDIDNFSLINEQHSHLSGDALIKQMARLLNNYVPNGGMLFRSSGEEFSMIVPDMSFDKTVRLAEAVRNSVERAHFHISDRETVHLTVSVGIAHQTVSSDTKGALFKEADDMLHAAKKYGQNRVMFNPI